jgi:choline monooxygenase
MRFPIDPDVTVARTLPSEFYLDPAVFEHCREAVFGRHWQWLGDGAAVAGPNHYAPRTLAPGALDEPVLLARDGGGELRVLSNVCTHRGHLIAQQPCSGTHLRCPYHGRRFDAAGRMVAMPGFKGAQQFPGPQDHLPQLPCGTWAGQVFAALRPPAQPLHAWLAPVVARVGWLPLDRAVHDPSRDRCFEFDAHWALYVENYLEGLHIPFVHPGLNRALDWRLYRYERFESGNLQLGLAADGEPAFEGLPDHHPEQGQRVAAWYFWLFPNLMLNVYPWGLSVNLVMPLAPARTRVWFRSYVLDPALLGQGAGGALDPVELEDEAAVQSVQRGLRSRLYRHGRYSPEHERGTHQFHRLLAAALG